jgi:transcriptional regulator with XRE-family HTH domain
MSRRQRDWRATLDRIEREVPGASDVDWVALFKADPKILGDLVNDVIKINISEKGRPGKRSARSAQDIEDDLRKLTGEDYAVRAFPEALSEAMGGRSIRHVASQAHLDKMTVHRLLKGKGAPPTAEQMEWLAKAVKKEPSYFMEYRAAYVCSVIYQMMMESSEAASIQYSRLRKVAG